MRSMSRFIHAIVILAIFMIFPLGAASRAVAAPPPTPESGKSSPGAENEARLKELEAKIRELASAIEALKQSGAGVEAGKIAELESKIDILTRELERLRLGEAAAPSATESRFGLGPAASKVYRVNRGVSVGGYGELACQNFDSSLDDGTASSEADTFDLLRAVLYFGYKFNDRTVFNSEIEFEHATTGEGSEEKGEVSVEFAYLDFLLKKGLNARAGLLLVPLGFINEMHEPPVFHGVRRPEVERVIIPATWRENGAGIFGDLGKFSYRVYIMAGLDASEFSAGSALRDGRQGGSQSKAEDLALTGRLDLTGVPGLLAGVSAHVGDSSQGAIDSGARVSLWDAHLQYQWRGFEFRGLFASGTISDVAEINAALGITPGGDDSVGEEFGGWYAQAAWDLLSFRKGDEGSLTPFIRYESFDTQNEVPSGFLEDPALNRTLLTLGLTWKPIPQVAVKVDFQDARNAAGTGQDQFNLGLGWLF